jgi:DNA-binding Xre family transcriptional regulator
MAKWEKLAKQLIIMDKKVKDVAKSIGMTSNGLRLGVKNGTLKAPALRTLADILGMSMDELSDLIEIKHGDESALIERPIEPPKTERRRTVDNAIGPHHMLGVLYEYRHELAQLLGDQVKKNRSSGSAHD